MVCSGEGTCIKDATCECNFGHIANDPECELLSCYGLTALDPTVCSGVGACTNWDHCDCPDGLLGDECELVEVCN